MMMLYGMLVGYAAGLVLAMQTGKRGFSKQKLLPVGLAHGHNSV